MKVLRVLFFRAPLAGFAWVFTTFVALAVASCSFDNQTQSRCLALGYPQSHTTWTWRGYCSRRVNNTDEVLRLP